MSKKKLDNEQIIKQDMEALYLGNLKTVEFDLELPTKGKYGSDIRWESGEERFLTNEGKVSRPLYGMSNREVVLTGFFSMGDAWMKKEYQVTILEQENPYKEEAVYRIDEEVDAEQEQQLGTVCECCDSCIRILPGNEFYDAQERMHYYLLTVDNDEMLYHFRKASGLDTKGANSPYGWDAEESKLKGHTTGHYLSALALCYHATGDLRVKDKAEYMVKELGKCQEAFSSLEGIQEGFLSGYSEEQFDLLEEYTVYPKIWAPYYTLHKIMAGLLDCYLYIESGQALAIAEKMGLWTTRRLSRLPHFQLKKMWSMYIAGEFGGMNAVMAQLAVLTGRKEFVECAKLFDNEKLFYPLENNQDQLSGMHANQHIPQIIGAVELYKAAGEKRYLRIAQAFWATVTRNRTYAAGGVGETEMFQGFGKTGSLLTANTQESCASYNMLKLTKELYQINPNVRYMDYYEKTLYNHILATLSDDDSGESTYFFPLGPGMRREFLRENSCCHGTGMESHFRYREGMYYRKDKEFYINLYIPSELETENHDLTVRLNRTSKREQRYQIRIRGTGIDTLYLRRPNWAKDIEIIMDGQNVEIDVNEQGYIVISESFSKEMILEVSLSPDFRIVRAGDEPTKAAIQYGPYLLAALSEEQEFIHVTFNEKDVHTKMHWENAMGKDAICFACDGKKWIPVNEVKEDAYHVYVHCDI